MATDCELVGRTAVRAPPVGLLASRLGDVELLVVTAVAGMHVLDLVVVVVDVEAHVAVAQRDEAARALQHNGARIRLR